MEKKHECCTPKGQVPRYVDCVGCDKKPIEGATLSYAEAQKDSFNIMEKKQTAVDYLVEKLFKIRNNTTEVKETNSKSIIDQAKQMEKEQMKEAALDNVTTNEKLRKIFEIQFEQYYNETYGGSDE
jgi:hypothetical protein